MKLHLLLFPLASILLVSGGCARKQAGDVAVDQPTPDNSMVGVVIMKPTPTSEPYVAPPPEVRAVEFSPDRKWLAIGTLQWPGKGSITVRDCVSNRVVKSWKFTGGVRHLAFSPDGENIAVTSIEDQLLVWNWKSGKLVHRAKTLPSEGRAPLDYAPDGRSLAVGVEDIQIFNTKTWKSTKLEKPDEQSLPTLNAGIRFSPDGRWLVTSDGFEGYAGYTIRSMSGRRTRSIAQGTTYEEIVFSRDSRFLAGVIRDDKDDFVFTYDLRKSKLKRVFKLGTYPDAGFTPQDFSPNARFLAGLRICDKSGPVEVRDLQNGKLVRKFNQTARAVAWLDNKTLLAGDENGVQLLSIKAN